jgi:zinc protease
VFLIDQPGAVQANIVAAQLAPSSMDPAAVAFDMANMVIGGDFTARLNMNLREDKHWSYGARSGAGNSVGPRMWTASAPVQIDKTAESVAEMKREIADFASGKPQIASMRRLGRPDDWPVSLPARWRAMGPEVVAARAGVLKPDDLVWVVVGDRSKLEEGVRALGWGEVEVWGVDGAPLP